VWVWKEKRRKERTYEKEIIVYNVCAFWKDLSESSSIETQTTIGVV